MRSSARTVPNSTFDSSLPAASGGEAAIERPSPGGTPPAGDPSPGRAAVSGPGPKLRPLSRIAWPGFSSGPAEGPAFGHRISPLLRSTMLSITGASAAPAGAGHKAQADATRSRAPAILRAMTMVPSALSVHENYAMQPGYYRSSGDSKSR